MGKWYLPLLGKKVTPLKKNSAPDLNRRCRLTQVDLDNGRIMVVAVVVVAGEAEIPTGKGTLGRGGANRLVGAVDIHNATRKVAAAMRRPLISSAVQSHSHSSDRSLRRRRLMAASFS